MSGASKALATATATRQGRLGPLGAVVAEDDVAGHQSVTGVTPGVSGGAGASTDSATSRSRLKKSVFRTLQISMSGTPMSNKPDPEHERWTEPLLHVEVLVEECGS